MLRRLMADLRGCPVMAADGFVGAVRDAYFDDRWTVRYLALESAGRPRLVSTESISDAGAGRGGITLAIDVHQVSHAIAADNTGDATARDTLRSACDVTDYSMRARDGGIGSLHDFIVDDRNWHITDLVADTRSWLPGKPRLISPDAVDCIDSSGHTICIRLTREEVGRSPRAH